VFRYVPNLSSQTTLRLGFRAVSDHDAREPAVEMLLRVLDDGMSTRLYERICDRKGLCYDVGALFESYEDDGLFDIAAEVQHARAALVVREILQVLEEIAERGPTATELDKARSRHGWQMRAMLDDSEGLSGFYALAAIADIARTPAQRHAELLEVSRADVREAAAFLFRRDRFGAVAVGSLEASQQRTIEREVTRFGG
jgi:predicted Zn-dependent peptidase